VAGSVSGDSMKCVAIFWTDMCNRVRINEIGPVSHKAMYTYKLKKGI
jgi:hypothetical protein